MALNKNGYHHLAKLSSIAFTEGFYYVPRIDKETLLQHKEDLLITTGGLWGEVPYLILNVGEEKAEEAPIKEKEVKKAPAKAKAAPKEKDVASPKAAKAKAKK